MKPALSHINREILRLSIPAIVSNITVPLLGLCDTAISGHLGSELFLAAIAVGSVMLNVVFWIFGFLRMGTTGLTAIAYGANDNDEVYRLFLRAFFLGVVSGVILIILRVPVAELLFKFIKAEDSIQSLVREYFMIRIWGAPALLATMAISGWFVGMQNTVMPLVISVGMNLFNILISFVLVFGYGSGFVGIAEGTMISNWLGLLIALVCFFLYNKWKIKKALFKDIFVREGLAKFFNVNSNLFIRSFCIIIVTLGVTAAGARMGAMVLAGNVILMQFFQFFSFFMDGFAFSGEALVGLYAGKRDLFMLNKSVKELLKWTVGMALAFCMIYLFCGDFITSMLTDSNDVRIFVGNNLLIIALIPIVSAWAFIYDGFYVGLTQTVFMMFSTIIASVFFFIILYVGFIDKNLFINEDGGIQLIWSAFLVYLGIRGIFLALLWKRRILLFFK